MFVCCVFGPIVFCAQCRLYVSCCLQIMAVLEKAVSPLTAKDIVAVIYKVCLMTLCHGNQHFIFLFRKKTSIKLFPYLAKSKGVIGRKIEGRGGVLFY